MHQLTPPVVHVDRDRAVVEVGAQIQFRDEIDGVPADLVSFARLLYQLHRQEGTWKIQTLRAIYERDTLAPVLPGAALELDAERLAQFRTPYRYLAYHLSQQGQTIGQGLYGDDQPERVAGLYTEVFDWLRRR